jgi:multiple sugar transport system ATP-binding protein
VQAGGEVIAGIRPEDFEDAALIGAEDGHFISFDAPIELTESMGSEIYAYFAVEAPAAQSQELAELAADSGMADVPSAGGEDTHVVARLDPESKVEAGQKARLALDTSKLHLFDPSDGTSLRHRGG